MTKQKPETDDGADSPRMSFDDQTIYPSRDHVTKAATPFTLGDYGDSGAFSEKTISWLAERHNLSEEQLRELSRLIGYSLDIDTEGNLIRLTRLSTAA